MYLYLSDHFLPLYFGIRGRVYQRTDWLSSLLCRLEQQKVPTFVSVEWEALEPCRRWNGLAGEGVGLKMHAWNIFRNMLMEVLFNKPLPIVYRNHKCWSMKKRAVINILLNSGFFFFFWSSSPNLQSTSRFCSTWFTTQNTHHVWVGFNSGLNCFLATTEPHWRRMFWSLPDSDRGVLTCRRNAPVFKSNELNTACSWYNKADGHSRILVSWRALKEGFNLTFFLFYLKLLNNLLPALRLKMCRHLHVRAERPQTLKDVSTLWMNRTSFLTTSLDPMSPVGAQTHGLCKHLDEILSGYVWRVCLSLSGHCLKEESLELNSDDQGNDLNRLNIICIKEEDPEDDDYLCKTAGHISVHSDMP